MLIKTLDYDPYRKVKFIKKYHWRISRIKKDVIDHDFYNPLVSVKPRQPDDVWLQKKK